ncbi:MAG: helix-turn-helix domain-containing protein [Desulfomonilaceae bacterium]
MAELDTAAGAAASLRSHVRMMAIKALLVGISHDQVAKLYDTTRRNLCRWIDRFNTSGIDGLVQKARSRLPRKITDDKRTEYIELVQRPDRANETHWTSKKFHGYLTKQLHEEIGHRIAVRWLHKQGFRLKACRWVLEGQKIRQPYLGAH